MKIQKVTAVMVVQDVQPCIEFWSGWLGFEATMTVPEGDEVGFAILARDGVEICVPDPAGNVVTFAKFSAR
jgi:catechol 2,3-dioxygenase-like lactoylglutathione lyase family enzyme